MNSVLDKLKSRVDYNISDASKEAIDYYFWVRPTSQWKCNAAEFKQTFDLIDEVAVNYEKTRIQRVFRPLYWFITGTFLVHTVFMIAQLTCGSRRKSVEAYPTVRTALLVFELITLFLFVVFS